MVNSNDIAETNSLIVAQLAAEKNKTAIPIAKIDQNYREETGERIPYAKLGYSNLVEYLKTVPGVKMIRMNNTHYVNFVGTEDSQHIVDLVSKQRSKNPTRNYQRYTRYSRIPNFYELSRKTNKNVTGGNRSMLVDDSFLKINCNNNHQSAHGNVVMFSDSDSDEADDKVKVSSCRSKQKNVAVESLKEYPFKKNPYQLDTGFRSLRLEKSEIKADTTNRQEHIFSQKRDYVSNVLSKRVRFRLEKLIQSRPQGIWCTELPKLYEEEYKIPLEWTDLGFHRLSDFTAHLSDIFHVVGPQINGDFKLYNAKEPLPDEKPAKTSKKLTTASLFDVNKKLYPANVMTIQETVGQVSVTDLRTSSNVDKNEHPMIEVEVVEAYSPSFFWIRLLKNKNKFHKMMKNLGKFYDENYQNYAVPIIMLERGLNIACVFYGKWHRAIIKSVDPSCRVSVLFYDYGTVDKYPSDEIFYLHRSFTALPAQAIPCGLYSVAPYEGDKWLAKARDWFSQWANRKALWASIIEVDTERNSMLVTLADTSGKDDFFINDWLIDKKVAKVKKMSHIRLKNFSYERYLQCQSIKQNVHVKTVDDLNTHFIPDHNELPSPESPLSGRISLLKKLCNNLNQDQSNINPNSYDVCPTCGNCTTKFTKQKADSECLNFQPKKEDKKLIRTPPYEYNKKESFNKVISWLKKHDKNDSELQEVKNVGELFKNVNNTSKNEVEKKNCISRLEKLCDSERIVDCFNNSKIENNYCKINSNQPDKFLSEKKGIDHQSTSTDDNSFEVELPVTRQKVSAIINDFETYDKDSNHGSEDIYSPKKDIQPINWDEIKTTMNKELKSLNHDSITFEQNKPIFTEQLSLTSKEKPQILEKMDGSFKNFIKTCYSSKTCQEDILKLKPEHEIVKSHVVTPTVVKILNVVNKSYEENEIVIPDDVQEILRDKSNDSVKTLSSNNSSNDLRDLRDKEINIDFKTIPEALSKKDEISENDLPSGEEISNNEEKVEYCYHGTLEKNLLKRFNQLEFESNYFEENSELDSDDDDNLSIEFCEEINEDKEKIFEKYEFSEQENDNLDKIVESIPIKEDNELNRDANRELAVIKEGHVPVFNDNESLTDDSEMDVCIEYDFLSQFYRKPTDLQETECTIEEINSDDENSNNDSDDNNDGSF